MILAAYTLTFLLSCSQDTDLLADLVVSDVQQAKLTANLVISDKFLINSQESTVLDVLINDSFIDTDKVDIIETSQPDNGLIVINTDKTLTYYPNPSDAPDEVINTEEKQSIPNEIPVLENQQKSEIEEPSETEEETNGTIGLEKIKEQEEEEEEEPIEETFTYTVEVENKEGEIETQEASVTIIKDMGELKAFPGAEGFGKNTVGGRGGFVYHVTNLNSSGKGSLVYGIREIKGPRTIVFDISGYIDLKYDCFISDPYITIAGETATGDGITIRGASVYVETSEVIIRYLNIRPGTAAHKDADCIKIVTQSPNVHIRNVIFDHLSLSWSKDENVALDASKESSSIENITVQNCLIAEPLNHYGILIGRNISKLSILRNLWANTPNRIPETTYGYTNESFEFINNIIYNYSRPTTIVQGTKVDIISNAYKMGTAVPEQTNLRYQSGPVSPDASSGRLYSSDNIEIGTLNPHGFKNSKWKQWERSSKFHNTSLYNPLPSEQLENALLTDVGNRINPNIIDSRILSEYRNGTGICGPRSEDVVGGFPIIISIERQSNYDKDKDGMADVWEIANNLDPTNPSDANQDYNNDGYTNLESFLYSLSK
ncbi:Ig-like domain-containing protein [Zobellia laminariae]|uniref:Ig-like domain-containing protein n=1 Tax=Zobellia laminariae TaxID=248906 RepID=UPI0026F46D26|nr:hypothetical protein [Zobellia laminariae]WKX76459.1 hypothetical protein Q5W13_23490 [Zobellia laminariae]